MSKDLLLVRQGGGCPHLIVEEIPQVGEDQRTLITKASVAGSNLARVYANLGSSNQYTDPKDPASFASQYVIPPSGLHSQARLQASEKGPYHIRGCVSDSGASVDANVLHIRGSQETITVRLPTGRRVTTKEVVEFLAEKLDTLLVFEERGSVVFLDAAEIGKRSQVLVHGRGAEAIGFRNQKAARGRRVFPGWELVKGDTLQTRYGEESVMSARYFRFRSPLRMNPLVRVTYPTVGSRCPRCGGTFVENDVQFDLAGELVFIENEDLLYQSALKILLTEKGTNPYHPEYGTSLMTRVGSKAVGAVAQQLREDVLFALERVRQKQQAQARSQRVSLREQLYAINSVDVGPHNNDPTALRVDVVVTNASGEPISLNISFAVPGSVALAGSNGVSLGLTGLTQQQQQDIFRR